jgi:hypothetical protein
MSEAVEEPKIETPPPIVKKKHVIQPTDKEGRAIGSPHVYYYTDEADLQRQLSDTVANGTRKIREMALGTPIKLTAPEGADLEDEETGEIPEFKPRVLTADEKFAIANKFKDPATVDEAFDEMFSARTGGKPEDFVRIQTKTAKDSEKAKRDAAVTRAKAEAIAFQDAHPEFIPNEANSNAMMTWITSHKDEKGRSLAMTVKNFELAYKSLSADGYLQLREPEPESIPAPKVEPEPAPVPRTEEPATRTRGTADLPSTIKPTDSSPSTSMRSNRPSAAAIAMMTSAQLKTALEKWPDLLDKKR